MVGGWVWRKVVKKYKLPVKRHRNIRGIMYNTMTTADTVVWYIGKLLIE